MTRNERDALDRHITGNYGADQEADEGIIWLSRLAALGAEADDLLDPLTCTQPGGVGGSQPGVHCAECCYGTLIAASCQEEYDIAVALRSLVVAVQKFTAGAVPDPRMAS